MNNIRLAVCGSESMLGRIMVHGYYCPLGNYSSVNGALFL